MQGCCDNLTKYVYSVWHLVHTQYRYFYFLLELPFIVFQSLSCPTLCDPMDCSMPGFPVLHCLLEFAQNASIELVMLSNHLIELVMLSNHLIFCLLVLPSPSIFPSIEFLVLSIALDQEGLQCCDNFTGEFQAPFSTVLSVCEPPSRHSFNQLFPSSHLCQTLG